MYARLVAILCLAAALISIGALNANAQAIGRRAGLANICGPDFRQTVRKMMAGQLSGGQATECWCYFWEKAGSNPTKMYNGRRAADLCK
jgi:hypothetical protein